ncbi:PP2C family protein-serine/threonine phosphatase [Kiritimatiella glycovorans]|uniref:Phosphoserine phosphatase RsbU n=1 Tax=Kiritimatiella glycovorans TaxID=1307763 RepID=A0A0G3EKW9_9BACT|nr:GAF domain-containing SpoIIE family protein phosphatase [Kiritimatiella glycovorans]AKJ65405.1 Phosphoserine phosphatase RsbU [Kiritimatiella glycovorans]
MNAELVSIWFYRVFSPLLLAALLFLAYRLYRHIARLRGQRDELLQSKNTVYEFLHDMGDMFSDAERYDIQEMMDKALYYATRTCKARSGAVYLLDEDRDLLKARAQAGVFPPLHDEHGMEGGQAILKSRRIEESVQSYAFALGEGLVGDVAVRGHSILLEDAELDERVPRHRIDFLRIHTLMAVPMRFGRKTVGVVVLANRVDGAAFTRADLDLLQSLADQIAIPLHYMGLNEQLEQKRQLDRDLDVAHEIQRMLLPQRLPDIPGVKLAAFNHPAQVIGGDYYDFIRIDDRHLGIVIADVSGKGIGGAMIMSICRSVLRAKASLYLSPAETLAELNRLVTADLAEDMFVSMLYMVLDLDTRELVVARAGHERPLLLRNGESRWIDGPGIAIGLTNADIFETAIRDVREQLQPGDLLTAYTDGITEAMDSEDNEWGVERLEEAVQTAGPNGPDALLENIRQRLLRFVGDRPQNDDMTLLAFRVD